MTKRTVLFLAGIGIALTGLAYFQMNGERNDPAPSPSAENVPAPSASPFPTEPAVPPSTSPGTALDTPVEGFSERITKKAFGIYITPQDSPVKPERFTGFHTGVDVEYADVDETVPVRAISDGSIVASRWASGYGGVTVLRFTYEGNQYLALYGHLDDTSLKPAGASVSRGEQIGSLGEGGSRETDRERKHLHFAVLKGNTVDMRGYVPDRNQLSRWIDPQTLW